MNNEIIGTVLQQGNVMRIENALVEEVFCFDDSSGYIVVSYTEPGGGRNRFSQNLRLNINRNTVILNSFGGRMCPCCIRQGMRIDAAFSARTTRSIPPQASAFLIIVQRRPQENPSVVSDGRIAFVDTTNNFLYTGNPNNINSQTRYVVTDQTVISDRSGRRIRLGALRPGQMVRITHANFQTASIPPQTTAFRIQLI